MACDTLQATKAFVSTNAALQEVQTEDNFIVTIEGGFSLLTYAIQTITLPQLKNEGIEYSIVGGLKQKAAGKIQPLQELPATLLERVDGSTTDMLQTILKSGLNGKLKVNFYVGKSPATTTDLTDYRLHSTLIHAGIIIEEGVSADVEGTTTVQKQSVTFFGNYIPCEENDRHDASNALAANTLRGLPLE